MIVTKGAAEALRSDLDVHNIAEAGQMSEPNGAVIAVEGTDRLPTPTASRGRERAFDLTNQLTIGGDCGEDEGAGGP